MGGFDPSIYGDHRVPMPTTKDLELIGAAVLNSVCTTLHIGHATPGETLDYLPAVMGEGRNSAAPMIVRDFVAWTSRRQNMAPGALQRLEQFVACSGWYEATVQRVGQNRVA